MLKTALILNLPFRIADSIQFRRLVHMLRPTADVPSPVTLRRDLKLRAEREREKIKTELATANKISLALDAWTSPNHLSFLAIVAYFITSDWKYKNILIGFEHLRGRHTGIYLSDVTQDVLDKYNLYDKLFRITTDNASNNQTLTESLESQKATREVHSLIAPWERDVMHIPCLSHVVQLAVNKFLDNIKAFDKDGKDRLTHVDNVKDDSDFRVVVQEEKSFQRTLTMVSSSN
jgi:hypothetical protein